MKPWEISKVKAMVYNLLGRSDPFLQFHSDAYLRHNARRLEHLASLGIKVSGASVLEVGAGIGDHSSYYLDRGCSVTITEAREENLAVLRRRYPKQTIVHLDLDRPRLSPEDRFGVVHCYGLLYHLREPELALKFMSSVCESILLLETCVSLGDILSINHQQENSGNVSQAVSGTGCRPTRAWIFQQLGGLFKYVYVPRTQPNHEEFPTDWTIKSTGGFLTRAVFVASRVPMENDELVDFLPARQERHD